VNDRPAAKLFVSTINQPNYYIPTSLYTVYITDVPTGWLLSQILHPSSRQRRR
jgi:hypothetical protein